LNLTFNFSTGPENATTPATIAPSSTHRLLAGHRRLKLGFEALYLYDGGINGNISGFTPAAPTPTAMSGRGTLCQLQISDMFTVNGRFEKAHGYLGSFDGTNFTVGGGAPSRRQRLRNHPRLTITPMPKDPILKGLVVRPKSAMTSPTAPPTSSIPPMTTTTRTNSPSAAM